MIGAVCPSCGVTVVPGYIRCPKCQAPLPRRPSTTIEGGTAIPDRRRFPIVAVIAAGVVGAGLIILFGLRGKSSAKPAQPVAETATAGPQAPTPPPPPTAPPAAPTQAGPDPQALANALERALRKQRLWSTVEVVGAHVDVRSSSCADPAIKPLLDGAAPRFKAAGLTKLRCLEQSGRVVSDRDL